MIRRRHVDGLTTIAAAGLTPMSAYLMHQTPLGASIVLSLVAMLSAIRTWADDALAEVEDKIEEKK